MPINEKQKRQLKKLVHHLKPVVMVGQHGLSDNIHHEIDIALDHHELIKVRVNAADKAERKAMIETIIERSGADLILTVGHVAAFFRRNQEDPKISLGG
jgi:RNA-binding protein